MPSRLDLLLDHYLLFDEYKDSYFIGRPIFHAELEPKLRELFQEKQDRIDELEVILEDPEALRTFLLNKLKAEVAMVANDTTVVEEIELTDEMKDTFREQGYKIDE